MKKELIDKDIKRSAQGLNTKELKECLKDAIRSGKKSESENGGGNGVVIGFFSTLYKASVARDKEREKNNWLFWVASIIILAAVFCC